MSATGNPIIDCHVHMVGNQAGGHGCRLDIKHVGHRILALNMLRTFGFPLDSLAAPLDEIYLTYVLRALDNSAVSACVLLANDEVYDSQGQVIADFGSLYIPNKYVLQLAKQYPQILAGVSINPNRRDALDELEFCAANGAVLMKCLPNCHNIDCSASRLAPFWKKMAELSMPLLAHTGGELVMPVYDKRYQSPEYLRLPLECGVTVIAAHCATSSHFFDTNYLPLFSQMIKQHPNLYGDLSGLLTPLRSVHFRQLLAGEFAERLVNGSDFPVPISAFWPFLRGHLSFAKARELGQISNPFERDFQTKSLMGFPSEIFGRCFQLIKERLAPEKLRFLLARKPLSSEESVGEK